MKPQKYAIRIMDGENWEYGYLSHFALYNLTGYNHAIATEAHFAFCVSRQCALRFSKKHMANALCRVVKDAYRDCEVEVIDIIKEEVK